MITRQKEKEKNFQDRKIGEKSLLSNFFCELNFNAEIDGMIGVRGAFKLKQIHEIFFSLRQCISKTFDKSFTINGKLNFLA